MTGRRPVTDPRSGQPGGSTAFLATLDGNLPAGGSAIVTVSGTTRKEKVTTVFPGSYSYAAGTQVLVMEVGGKLRCWVDSSATAGASDCDCCDLRNCVDQGQVTDCSAIGEAMLWFDAQHLSLPTPFCEAIGSYAGVQHVGGCVWESPTFHCDSGGPDDPVDVFLWRLTASPFPAKLELIHVSGDHEIPAIVYYALKPFSGLCGNEFWLHSAPGPNWAKDHPGWAGNAFFGNPGLSNHVCLGPAANDCTGVTGPVPEHYVATVTINEPGYMLLSTDYRACLDGDGNQIIDSFFGAGLYQTAAYAIPAGSLAGSYIMDFYSTVTGCLWLRDSSLPAILTDGTAPVNLTPEWPLPSGELPPFSDTFAGGVTRAICYNPSNWSLYWGDHLILSAIPSGPAAGFWETRTLDLRPYPLFHQGILNGCSPYPPDTPLPIGTVTIGPA